MQLTDQQTSILSEVGASFRVLAGAGSGKTTTMATYVKAELVSKRSTEDEICFITFTRFAADQIKRKIKSILGRSTRILYGTFHATMWKLLYAAGLEPINPVGLYDARMEEGVRHFLDYMKARNERLVAILTKFKVLIVDEFQDLDAMQFQFVKEFKAIQPGLRVIAIGDLAQNIYRFRGTSNEFLRTRLQREVCPDLRTFDLTMNFRSTKAILDAVNTIFAPEIKEGHILPMVTPMGTPMGPKPQYYEYAKNPGKGMGEYENLVVTTLLPIIKESKKSGKSLALIFPKIKCQSFQIITALLRNASQNTNSAYDSFDIHQIAKEDVTCSTVAFDYDPASPDSPIQCSSFHASKGLEWDIVALINLSDDLYNIRGEEDTEAFYAEKTNIVYVGITRAAKELYIFADANCGGRCRLFSRLGDQLGNTMDITLWGEDDQDDRTIGRLRPVGVTDLLRRLPQHPDLFERARKCSETIAICGRQDGLKNDDIVYAEMKKRNREMAFGTYIDWKLKKALCKSSKPIQDILLELKGASNACFTRQDAYDSLETRLAKLDVYFLNTEKGASEDLLRYVTASRHLAFFTRRVHGMVPAVADVWRKVQNRILGILAKPDITISEEYILSQAMNFYMRGVVSEIQAVDAPLNSYQGLPEGFEDFVSASIETATGTLMRCIKSLIAQDDKVLEIKCDIPLETECLILGEGDMLVENILLEIKCSASPNAIDLRDAGNCKNLMQVLSYIAMGRHGTIPFARPVDYACLTNPLTGAWELYDLKTWPSDDSTEFLSILEELHGRN